jgi:hypothetical protein
MKLKAAVPAVLLLALIAAFIDSNVRMVVTTHHVTLKRLPPAFNGFTIAHLTDLHMEEFGTGNRILLNAVREAQPDIIVFTGDLATDTMPCDEGWERVETLFQSLVEIAPVYFVTGNHDIALRAFMPRLRPILRNTGVIHLENEAVYLSREGQRLCIAGADDPLNWFSSAVLSDLREEIIRMGDPCTVLLSHRFERFDEYIRLGFDLTLAGHAHGGAVRLPFTDGVYGPFRQFFPKRTSGINREGDGVMVTGRGFQRWLKTPRLFNNPELGIVILQTP